MSANFDSKVLKKIVAWLCSSDTGVSSKTMVSAITGVPMEDVDVPHDPSDFGRCHRLLTAVPELREHLALVSKKYPKWNEIIGNWDRLTSLYLRDLSIGRSHELYRILRSFRQESNSIDTQRYVVDLGIKTDDKIIALPGVGVVSESVIHEFQKENSKKPFDFIFLVKYGSLHADQNWDVVICNKSATLVQGGTKTKYSIVGCYKGATIKLNQGNIHCVAPLDVSFEGNKPAKKSSLKPR